MIITGRTFLDFQGLEPNTRYEVSIRKPHSTATQAKIMLTDAEGNFVVAQLSEWHNWDQCQNCNGSKVILINHGQDTIECPDCANCENCS